MADVTAYQYWLHNLPGIGDRTIEKLLKRFGSARAVYHARAGELRQVFRRNEAEIIKEFSKNWDLEKKYAQMLQKGIVLYTLENEKYPVRLRKLEHPPYALYCMGKLPEEQRPSIAIIGARECSEYGSYVAGAFAGKMAAAGVSVISGMARGIDGISQRAAIDSNGKTYAVLGCGVDVCYPASNQRLYQDILRAEGGILSVFPPGTSPRKNQFPERNRIVAGLADVLLVVEARTKSGTWITVDMALEQGKNVYAVPGRLTDRLSDGCNLLIRQGAGIALTPEDILAEMVLLGNRNGNSEKDANTGKGDISRSGQMKEEDRMLGFLDFYPKSADDILREVRKSGKEMELPQLLTALMELCIQGSAKQVAGNYFARVKQCEPMDL